MTELTFVRTQSIANTTKGFIDHPKYLSHRLISGIIRIFTLTLKLFHKMVRNIGYTPMTFLCERNMILFHQSRIKLNNLKASRRAAFLSTRKLLRL